MYITKENLTNLIKPNIKIIDALKKIEKSDLKFCLIVDNEDRLLGSVTDGDIRRCLISGLGVDSTIEHSGLLSRPVTVAGPGTPNIDKLFSSKIRFVPSVNDKHRLMGVYIHRLSGTLNFGGRLVGPHEPTFVIAEIGNNHNGCIDTAFALVDSAREAGADCVKFQMRQMDQIYRVSDTISDDEDLGSQYVQGLLLKHQLRNEDLLDVMHYAESRGLVALCTPFDETSLEILDQNGVSGFKIASADFLNWPLLEKVIETKRPFIASTGMATEMEIFDTLDFIQNKTENFGILHCNSTYPAPYKDINLHYISHLKDMLPSNVIGYSGHERGYEVAIGAVALGCKIIEKHFTHDKNLEGNDHKVSLLPCEFKEMVSAIRNIELALGSSGPRTVSQGERLNKETLGKSLIVKHEIPAGKSLEFTDVKIMSPGGGITPNKLDDFLGRRVQVPKKKNELLYESDFVKRYDGFQGNFRNRAWGIPVRFHDYKLLRQHFNADFYEFHLSYEDLHVDMNQYLEVHADKGFVVHAPELFAGDHVLDLCNDDADYKALSIKFLEKTIDTTLDLRAFFKNEQKPMIIVNVGGWSIDAFIDDKSIIDRKYKEIEEILLQFQSPNYELIIQTMPPYPWHFGGQRFHNLFVSEGEIIDFCSRTGIRLCLDIAHSYMSCRFMDIDFIEHLRKLASHVAYLHVVDASGVDQEGMNLGEGEINFHEVWPLLHECCPDVRFIPEIWQGHKNRGEGFAKALNYLSELD